MRATAKEANNQDEMGGAAEDRRAATADEDGHQWTEGGNEPDEIDDGKQTDPTDTTDALQGERLDAPTQRDDTDGDSNANDDQDDDEWDETRADRGGDGDQEGGGEMATWRATTETRIMEITTMRWGRGDGRKPAYYHPTCMKPLQRTVVKQRQC
jgi:hypothetical protein